MKSQIKQVHSSLSEEALGAETAQAWEQTPEKLQEAKVTINRFHQELSESSTQPPIKKPKHYMCPEGKAYIETQGQKHSINILLNSSSNLFLLNQETTWRLSIPTETKHTPLAITTFHGETAPTGGKFYTHPILLDIGTNGQRSLISCKIANAGKYDLIIPFGWWYTEHPLLNIEDRKK